MIQLPKVSKELEAEYLESVQKSYIEALENLKDDNFGAKKKNTETESEYIKRKNKCSSEVNAIIAFLSEKEKLDDDKIKNLLVGEVPYLEKAMVKIGQIESIEIQKEFERVYTNFSNRKFGHQWAERLGVTVCPYCNRSYIFTVRKDASNGKARPQYDHFFPKSKYPYLAVSMYNLIPSCAVCNSGKSDKDSFQDQKVQYLNPYVEGYGTKTFLQIAPKKKKDRIRGCVGLAEEYTVKPKSAPDVDKDAAKRIQDTWDLLKLGPLYEKHSDYIRNILRAKQIYTEEYLDQLMKSFPGAFDDMDDLRNVVYFNYLDEEDWGKRILAKLTHDLEAENS